MQKDHLIQELVNTYSEAYKNLGYSSLMGKIVALLLVAPEPLSLDEISEQLQMSKGPISQISRKLKDNHLIERVWVPGERKDYYRVTEDIFGQAFSNYTSSMKRNLKIAEHFLEGLSELEMQDEQTLQFSQKMQEMAAFYDAMYKHNREFLEKWRSEIKPNMEFDKVVTEG